jgi:hypothetical protein
MSSSRQAIAGSFETAGSFVTANLDGLDAETASRPAGPGGSHAHWVLGHIVYWRNQLAGMLGGTPIWGAGEHEEFRGVQKGDVPDSLGRDFAGLQGDFAEVSDRLGAALEGCSDESEALGMATFLALHEAYHAGQLAVFRRQAGLAGAVGQ